MNRDKALIRAAERKWERERRKQFWREVRCYWTRPFGHAYGKDGRCVGCGSYPRINL